MTQQKCLVLDIETSPILAYVWGIRDQYINTNQIVNDWNIMAWSAKWLGDPPGKILYRDRRNSDGDEKILRELWPLLNDADILITQNGKAFDSKKINARFMLLGLKPPKPYKHHDTYRIAKSVADFTSHKLEYLTDKLCTKYKKMSHKKFPGVSLWVECLKGNKEAWEEMKRYNIQDVLSTEELYNKIRAWAPQNAARVYLEPLLCRMCGSKTQRRGYNETGTKHRIVCISPSCGRWGTAKIEATKERKK